MKVKLLKKVKKKIKFYERNGRYFIDTGAYMDPDGKSLENAKEYYRFWIIKTAQDIFKFRPKFQFYASKTIKKIKA